MCIFEPVARFPAGIVERAGVDALISGDVHKESIGKHMKGAGSRYEEGRHELMPEFNAAHELEEGWCHKGGEESQEEESYVVSFFIS